MRRVFSCDFLGTRSGKTGLKGYLVYQTYCEWEMMVSGLDANVSSVADVRKGRVGSVHYGSENIQGLKIS
ncbi:hypothetical protein Tco_1084368, partial [Tanacetum coccineum]